MRKLAIAAFSFSGAVFAANYLLRGGALLPLGVGAALLCLVCGLLLRRRKSRRLLAAALVLGGLAAGWLWTQAYAFIFFRPAQALDDRTTVMTGAAADWPQATEYGGYSVLVRVDTPSRVKLSAVVYVDEQGAQLRPGDRIQAVTHWTLGDRTFSGEAITYYTAKGIFLQGEAYGRLEIRRPERPPLWCWAALLSRQLKEGIEAAFPPEQAPLILALVTGNRDNLTDQFTSSLQRTGLSHTVAVSGMHLAFLASLLSLSLGRGKRGTAAVTAVCVVLFCGVAGNTPSVLRSAVMILMLQAAPLLERERDGPTALGAALMVLLAWNPFSAAHIGLQLSFAAVAGIQLAAEPIQRCLRSALRLDRPREGRLLRLLMAVPNFLISTLASTLGASVLTVPLVALHFQTISLISPLSNLLTLWAVSVLFAGGLVLGVAGAFLPGLACALALPFLTLADYLEWAVNALGRLSFAALPTNSFYYRAWLIFLCLLMVSALYRGRKRLITPVCAGIVTLCLSLVLSSASAQLGDASVSALDVGQGQSVLLRSGQFLTLVDCGGDSADNPGDLAADYLQSQGWDRLDLLVVSHFHDDHANGVPQLLRRLEVDTVALPNVEEDSPLRAEILAAAQAQGCQIRLIEADTTYTLEDGGTLTLFPPLGRNSDTNELGLTVLARFGALSTLITGDMSGQVEPQLLAHTQLPQVDVLVAGHHGSQTSTTAELLAQVQPEFALISVGRDNHYGHPGQETLERLAQAGAAIYRTDLSGTVTVSGRANHTH